MKTKLIHDVRAPKNKRELANIIKAQRISEKVLMDAVRALKVGVTELEIEALVKRRFVKYGAPILSFTPIVAFGKGSADIHHVPGKNKLKKGDIVMFDIGTTVNHYCSDMTRTFFFSDKITPKQKKMYEVVLEAQRRAMEKIARGERRASVIDKTARDYIAKKYPNNFKHGLGHGVGTVIHEWPNFKPRSEDIIPTGCVMTVEPGVYLKRIGGVRIEDMILITKTGYKHLTKVPSDLENAILLK